MFKVIIIDDEPIIRKGLKNIINWKQFDCELCGEASDGIEGCELARTVLPDIIITDIRMPEVDGLSMVRQIKEIVPHCKIIILTGHRNFEYVQEAIKLGVMDFILKPSKIEELTSIIGRAVKELKFQKDKAEEIDKLKKLFEQNIPILKEKLLYDILYEININNNDILAKMELYNIKIDKFVLLMLENDEDDEDGKETRQYDKHLYQFGIINTCNEIFSVDFKVTSTSLNDRWIALILGIPEEKNIDMELLNNKCTYLQSIIQGCFGFTITIAVSSEGNNALELPLKFKECRNALEHKFYMGNNSIIFYNDLESFFQFDDNSKLDKYQKALLETIKSGNIKIVKEILQEIFNYINSIGNINKEHLKSFYWSTINSINNIRISVRRADNDYTAKDRDISSLYKMIEKCDSIKDLNTLMEEIVLGITEKVNSFNNKSIKLVLKKAIDYLQNNYNKQITLNEVAENIYVSTYYISRMFKKELGKNFVDYLNEIRIERAKELLKDVKYKTYEVAELVGIPDAHYFSKLFKKHEGITPTEFRAQ